MPKRTMAPLVEFALSREWGDYPIWIYPKDWALPAGTFGESNGPI